jgi:hypothetical protein
MENKTIGNIIRKKSKKNKAKLYLEVSKYLLDVSKLIFGGIVLAGIFELGFDKIWLLIFGLLAVILTAALGIAIFILGQK